MSIDPVSPVEAEVDGHGRGLEQSRSATRDRVKRALRPLSRVIPPLRRLLDHRDQLAVDISALRSTIWRFSEDRQRFLDERMRIEPEALPRETTADPPAAAETWMRHHPYSELGTPVFPTSLPPASDDDNDLVCRIIDAYHDSADQDHYGGAIWRRIAERHAAIHDALMRRDHGAVTAILRKPNTNYLFFGYEYFYRDGPIWGPAAVQDCADRSQDALVRLAEALGLLSVENPEGNVFWGTNVHLPTGEIVERIKQRLGIELAIQPVQGGFTGLAVGDRLLNDRMLHGAYYAHRVRQLVARRTTPQILEIGAGLGYSAYYAHQMGLRDYTIVDLPMTNVAQAYFLGRMLGPDRVVLEGESETGAARDTIKIRTPSLLTDPHSFDLVLNADSLTEVGAKLAFEYVKRIFEMSDTLLSVNHEANEYCVAELFDGKDDVEVERFPFWLRNGYVEEIVRTRPRI
jgi:hypothetical protein